MKKIIYVIRGFATHEIYIFFTSLDEISHIHDNNLNILYLLIVFDIAISVGSFSILYVQSTAGASTPIEYTYVPSTRAALNFGFILYKWS